MADKIKGITVSIGGNTDGLQNALKKVNKEIKATQSDLKEVEKLLKLDPTNTNLLKEKQALLAKEIEKTKNKLEGLNAAQKQAAEMLANGEIGEKEYQALAKQIERCESDLGELETQAKEVSDKIGPSAEAIGQKFQEVGGKITEAGKALAPFSALAAAGLGYGVNAAADWETAFVGVQKTVNATADEYDDLADGIKEMATRTASSSEEIAGVAAVAGQLGVGVEDILDFTEAMVMLGDTTNVSAEDAATTLARFINVTGSSKKDVKNLGSAVVALGNNFATDEASILSMSQRLAAAGTLAGLSETEILALATSMSSVGIEAEAGGTAMTQSMNSIDKIVRGTAKDSGNKLEKLANISGMSAEEFATAWQEEPIVAIQAFIGGLGDLDAEGESATEVLDDLGMSGIRQSNTLKSLALASGTLASAIQTSNSAYESNTALAEEAEKRYGTLESQVAQTKEGLKQCAAELGEILIPVLKDLMEAVQGAVDWFKSLDEGTKETIVTVAGIVAALSPVLLIVGKLTTAIGSIVKAFPTITSFLSGIGGPITVAVAAIGGLVGAIVSYRNSLKEAYDKAAALTEEQQALVDEIDAETAAWNAVKQARKDAYADIQTQTEKEKALWKALQKVVDANGKVIKGHEKEAETIVNELQEALGIEINLIDGQIENYASLCESIDQVIAKKAAEAMLAADEENYANALKNHTKAAVEVAKAEKGVADQEKAVAKQAAEVERLERLLAQAEADLGDETGAGAATRQKYNNELATAKQTLEGAKENLDKMKQAEADAKKNLQEYSTTIGNYQDLLDAISTGSIPDMETAVQNLSDSLVTAKNGNKETLEAQTKAFLDEYSNMRDIVDETGSEAASDAADNMEDLVERSIEELEKLDPELAAEMRKQLNTINENSDSWEEAGEEKGEKYGEGLKDGVDKVNLPEHVKKKLSNTNAYNWGKELAKNYADGIKANTPQVQTAASQLAKKVHEYIGFSEPEKGPLSDFHTYGPDMMELLASGIRSSEWEVLQAAQGVASTLRDTLQGTTLTAQLDQTSIPLGTGVTLNIANFNNYSDSDIRELTNEIMETAAQFAARKGAVFA